MNRSAARITLPKALGAAAVIAGVAVALALNGGQGAPFGGTGTAYAGTGALKPFDSCDSVLKYFQDRAPEYLIERAGGGNFVGSGTEPASGSAESARDSGGAASGAEPPVHSTTNVQEAGVDEPDLVKTDGDRIVAVAQARVHLVSADGGGMKLRKTLPETTARNVFLSGDRLLVFSGPSAETFAPGLRWAGQRAVLTMYDITDLSRPQRIATLTIDGDVLDARMVGTQVRVATAASPDVDAPSPVYSPDGRISERSKDQLRAAIARTQVDDWVPTYTLEDGSGAPVAAGRLVECGDLARPEKFSGLDTVAVTSFDMGSALQSREAVGVIAGGQQIYATDVATYVATTDWSTDDGSAVRTSMHKFVTARSGATSYRGSGEVPGTLLNSYAMSEHEGVLRIATTVSERRGWVAARAVTEGVVTTLREQDGVLRQLGQVGGLGREDNESIMAVRFIEDRGYVVTFRQTDPLYILDLSNAAAPEMVGELKIPGYSGYLHPIGKDLLLGAGQSGGGRVDPSSGQPGVQFSLFDINDPAEPRRIDTQTYGGGAAGAELDPRAFLYWEPRNLVLAPTSLYGNGRGQGAFSGVVLLRADADGLTEVGRLAGREANGMTHRSVVIGDTVYLLSDQALQANSLDTHRKIDELVF
jgi:uncharacterized secreted protein with C-terminal beta-propeller domain